MQALKAGASGYVLKDSCPEELIQAIRQVLSGNRYLSPQLNERMIQTFIQYTDTGSLDPLSSLTDREREVLKMTVEGLTSADIGEKLSLSSRTVETHRQNMMNKLDIKTQVELIRFALRHGIISMDD